MSEDEIIDDLLLYQISEHGKRHLKHMTMLEIPRLHVACGQALRHYYRLTEPDNPHVSHTPGSLSFPDEVSMRILLRAWSKLTGNRIDGIDQLLPQLPRGALYR